jgi:integrase
MAADRLTAIQVERAHRLGMPTMLPDGQNLYFRKQTPSGASWAFRYRFAGRPRLMALGNFPDMSLREARVEARRARVLLDKGVDPMADRRARLQAARKNGSFRQLAEEWYATEISQGPIKHPQVARRHLDRYLLPALGSKLAIEVTADDVAKMLDRMRAEYPTAANDLLRYTKRVFEFGVRRQIVHSNPAAFLTPRRDAGGAEKPRTRALSEAELRNLFDAIGRTSSFGEPNALAIKLLLSLCVRKSELLTAKWPEFDLAGNTAQGPVWRLAGGRTKTGTSLDIPLSPTAVSWLERLRSIGGDSAYVFPRRRHAKRSRYAHVGTDTLNAALSQLAHGLDPFTVHDLRRTARTMLAEHGVSFEVAERCLGHKLHGVAGIYNTHDYFDERREALARLAKTVRSFECNSPRGKHSSFPIAAKRKEKFGSAKR